MPIAADLIPAVAAGDLRLSIPVAPGVVLVPITRHSPENAELIEALTRWRNTARDAFFTQFEATAERTRRWLIERVVPDPRRLLFVMRDADGPIGTLGFTSLTRESAELDNLVRGERRGGSSLVYDAEVALVRWLFESFQLGRVEAAVLSGNFPALQLHQAVGFTIAERRPLRRIEDHGMVSYVISQEQPPDAYEIRMVLRREELEG